MDGKQFASQLLGELGLVKDRLDELLELAKQPQQQQAGSDDSAEALELARELITAKNQLENVGRLAGRCEMLTERLDHIASTLDVRYGRTWANPLLRHAVKVGVVIVMALASVGLYQIWLVLRAAVN